jgi:hypothetical protein
VSRAARAFAHVRVRAAKSRLARRADVLPLLCASDEATRQRALAMNGPDRGRLLAAYRLVMKSHPHEGAVFEAMLRLHAVEQIKDARRRGAEPGELVIGVDAPKMEELALDRWASRQLLECARRLPVHERLARQLLESIVRARDNELLRRGERFFGLSPSAAAGLTVLQKQAVNPTELRATRRRLCRRAFVGHTFELAPSIAYLLLVEEELRGLTALAERSLDGSTDAAVEGVLAGGLMGEGG